jgi:hypothetical protein
MAEYSTFRSNLDFMLGVNGASTSKYTMYTVLYICILELNVGKL